MCARNDTNRAPMTTPLWSQDEISNKYMAIFFKLFWSVERTTHYYFLANETFYFT